ncbi:MAG: hypothetical protein R8K22_00720, partial [Mariprofundaceae bacterium]
DNSFTTIVLFFLLHEMPHEARLNTLNECLRILAPGGSLLITEYAALPKKHCLYRFLPFRWILTTLEPFLSAFWHEDLEAQLKDSAALNEKKISCISQQMIFSNFYRVLEFKVSQDNEKL